MGLCTAMRPADSDSQPTDPQKEPAQQRHFLCVDNPRLMQATPRPHIRQPAACPVLWGATCCQRSSYRCHYNNAENHDNVHIMQLFPNFMKGKKAGGTFRRHLSGEAPHRVSDSPPFVPSASGSGSGPLQAPPVLGSTPRSPARRAKASPSLHLTRLPGEFANDHKAGTPLCAVTCEVRRYTFGSGPAGWRLWGDVHDPPKGLSSTRACRARLSPRMRV